MRGRWSAIRRMSSGGRDRREVADFMVGMVGGGGGACGELSAYARSLTRTRAHVKCLEDALTTGWMSR